MMTDTIGDMLTRIRNAIMARHDVVEIPHSILKEKIIYVLKKEGFIKDFLTEGGKKKILRVYLKYLPDGECAIHGLRRESTPGLRKYISYDELRKRGRKINLLILTTSAGVMSENEAKKLRVGGEILCSVW
jgi:small subunit ribosomal protein S8